MTEKTKNHVLVGMVPILLLLVLSAGVLSVLIGGVNTYRSIEEKSSISHTLRTAAGYINTRISQMDRANDTVSAEKFGGRDALVIRESIGERVYLTRIYCYEGYLYQLFSPEDAILAPADGEKLIPLSRIEISCEGALIEITVTDASQLSRRVVVIGSGEDET